MTRKSTHDDLERRIEEPRRPEPPAGNSELSEPARALLAGSPHAAYLLDLSGRVVAVNRRGAEHVGTSVEALIGKRLRDHFPAEVAEARRLQGEKAVKSGKAVTFEDAVGDRCYLSTIAPVRDERGRPTHLAVYAVEITAHKAVEDSLRESQELYRVVTDNIADVVWVLDLDKNRFKYISPSVERLLGYTPEEALALVPDELLSTRTGSLLPSEAIRRRALSFLAGDPSATTRVAETAHVRKDGSQVCIETSTTLLRNAQGTLEMVGVSRDITQRREAEEELRRSEETYRTLFEEASEGIVLVDLETGKIIDCNHATLALMGSERSAIVGSRLEALHPAGHAPPLHGTSPATLETTLLTEMGTRRDVEVKTHRVTLGGRAVLQALYRDITESKQLEEKLRHADKMEAVGTLARGIAHDFNNLLTGIQGNASLLRAELGARQHERLQAIDECVRSGAELAAQLLGYAREGRFAVLPIDCNALVRRAARMFGRSRKEIEIDFEPQDGLWTVEADQGQIEQVLVNLFVNAWQAMPGGGKLTLRTANRTLEDVDVASFDAPAGRYVQLSVSDTGVGMDDATQRRIFEPFFTTKEMGRGTGLGLATVYGIVKGHGGFVSVHSEKGTGSVFDIYLPASDSPATSVNPAAGAVLRGTETILLVDDEEIVLRAAGAMLESLGYRVLAVRNGEDAIERFQQDREEIALVILDMIMPGVGGGETYDRLRDIDPHIRVLLASGYSLGGDARAILARGCHGFIQKPFDLDRLSHKVREVLDAG